jgi:hypothetical protein
MTLNPSGERVVSSLNVGKERSYQKIGHLFNFI